MLSYIYLYLWWPCWQVHTVSAERRGPGWTNFRKSLSKLVLVWVFSVVPQSEFNSSDTLSRGNFLVWDNVSLFVTLSMKTVVTVELHVKEFLQRNTSTIPIWAANQCRERYCIPALKGRGVDEITAKWDLSTSCHRVTGAVAIPLRSLRCKVALHLLWAWLLPPGSVVVPPVTWYLKKEYTCSGACFFTVSAVPSICFKFVVLLDNAASYHLEPLRRRFSCGCYCYTTA